MHDSRMIQALHAAISRSNWSEVERAANALRDDEQSARKLLAGTDIGSLPHDMTTADMAKLRMATLSTLTAERDALKRERDEAREALESARTSMRNARGAVESNQVEDKDVRGTLNQAIQRINSFLAARSALTNANAAEREG